MIDAQVKVVKCILDHIPVDISFNKVGGFSSLCLLETVNKYIRRGHLFKQSIILIKAYCYYECRILGASYGLISTYALETMILHIIRAVRAEGGQFKLKPINILDPLNDENNLGRSISLGNCYRIYQKLREALMLQDNCISDGIKKFFVNTINRRYALEMENRVAACVKGRYYKVANLHIWELHE
ncbi:hypothetical protein ACP275_03G018200 [Erythranthe tilingii]